MKLHSKYCIFIILVLLITIKQRLSATSLGVYSSVGAGQMTNFRSVIGRRQVYDNCFYGGGIIFETKITRIISYNYRINLGFEKVDFFHNTYFGSEYGNIVRSNLTNTICYVFRKAKRYNLWFGPQFGLHILSGNKYDTQDKYARDNALAITHSLLFNYLIDKYHENDRFMDLIVSFSPVVGINITPTDIVAISLESGFRCGIHFGIKNSHSNGSMFRYEGYFNLSFLFSIKRDDL